MDAIDDIRRRMRMSNLQAKMELCEIERTALMREINSPLTAPARKVEAIEKRDDLQTERAKIQAELEFVQNSSVV